ncbi:hypothetical protein NEMBOFW57_003988 [Staphylotrichum longicolle]|uniref:Heterokaryon incompatibility domain-containing protein n=1 Tax=Staphylotrichum longicolle TaxID=669026 RepID=A0AAD4I376_9PEZI|nr:hypothetical protein NEMBOFW57_003988 [Staphylotrichum longicolle]
MRLLSSRTLTFHEFVEDSSRPRYAILSHRWEDDEVGYKHMRKPERRGLAEAKKGFAKISACAKQALAHGLEYFWVDTCCIDKSSSAELSEAINSMFRWYRDAAHCYVYLCDTPPAPERYFAAYPGWEAEFTQSVGFSRGWTLQEMIAPQTLTFYARDWTWGGDKRDVSLLKAIEGKTGVPGHVLYTGDVSSTSLAQRMSWIAHRQTTRTEDMAYCLLGIFDINMPLLYGEGDRAFLRLQQEILKASDDMSIFCWTDPDASFATYSGLLARSPLHFAACQDIRWNPVGGNPPFDPTNKGIRITLELKPVSGRKDESIAVLRGVQGPRESGTIGLYLHKIGVDQYARVDPHLVCQGLEPTPMRMTTFFVRQNPVMETGNYLHSRTGSLFMKVGPGPLRLVGGYPAECWDDEASRFCFDRSAMAETTGHPLNTKAEFHIRMGKDRTILITVDDSMSVNEWNAES